MCVWFVFLGDHLGSLSDSVGWEQPRLDWANLAERELEDITDQSFWTHMGLDHSLKVANEGGDAR